MLKEWFYNFKIGRTITALNSLDDATLKDIGLHRSNIRSHAYEVFKRKARKRSNINCTTFTLNLLTNQPLPSCRLILRQLQKVFVSLEHS